MKNEDFKIGDKVTRKIDLTNHGEYTPARIAQWRRINETIGTVVKVYKGRAARRYFDDANVAVLVTFPGTIWAKGVVIHSRACKKV